MKSLQECLDTYKQFGLDDLQIIEQFFVVNKLESKAAKLLSNLTEKQFDKLHYINSTKDMYRWQLNCFVLSDNKYKDIKDKNTLYELINKYLFIQDLNEEEIKTIKEIFKRNDITVCPKQFYDYINGIENIDTEEVKIIRGE